MIISRMEKRKVIVYSSALNEIGGVETFIFNFCRRLSKFYDITFVFNNANTKALLKVSQYVDCAMLGNDKLECDTLLLATAWGKNPEGQITAEKYIQVVHADYIAYIEGWKFKYQKGLKTTHHVAVGHHVAKQFEIATPYKIDAVIHNLL